MDPNDDYMGGMIIAAGAFLVMAVLLLIGVASGLYAAIDLAAKAAR